MTSHFSFFELDRHDNKVPTHTHTHNYFILFYFKKGERGCPDYQPSEKMCWLARGLVIFKEETGMTGKILFRKSLWISSMVKQTNTLLVDSIL